MVKNLPALPETQGLIPEWGRSSGEVNGSPLQYSWPGEFHGQRSLAGYSPWGRTELDTTEGLTLPLIRQTGWYFSLFLS